MTDKEITIFDVTNFLGVDGLVLFFECGLPEKLVHLETGVTLRFDIVNSETWESNDCPICSSNTAEQSGDYDDSCTVCGYHPVDDEDDIEKMIELKRAWRKKEQEHDKNSSNS